MGRVSVVPNRRLASVRGVPTSSPPRRRACRSSPRTSQQSPEALEEMRRRLRGLIEGSRVMIFSKTYCPHSSLEAAILGKKVMVLDFVVPSPQGTSWGLGGACVNVGCIPKKLMHQAALLGQALQNSRRFGWEYNQQVRHNWKTLSEAIQNHIGSLNWSYRLALREKGVAYINAYGEFVDPRRIKATD